MDKHRKLININKHSNKQTSLQDEIKKFLDKLRSVQEHEYKFWKENVSKEIAESTIPMYIKNEVLFVKVRDDIQRFELTRTKEEILKTINKSLTNKIIKDIVFI